MTSSHNKELTELHQRIDTFRKEKGGSLTVTEILQILIDFLKGIPEEGKSTIIGYVAGSITSDGPEFVDKNIEKLSQYAFSLRSTHGHHIFCSKEIFSKLEQEDIVSQGETAQIELRSFWRKVLESELITDLFMIPGWERSIGAMDEHKKAKDIGTIKIHYLKEK